MAEKLTNAYETPLSARPDNSGLLDEIRATGVGYGFCAFKGSWGVSIAEQSTARLHAVLEGTCLIRAQRGQWSQLEPGDIAFLAQGTAHDLADRPGATLRPLSAIHKQAIGDSVYAMTVTAPGSPRALLSCSEFEFSDESSLLLRLLLPEVVILPGQTHRDPLLKALLTAMSQEIDSSAIGRSVILKRLADLLVIKLLRACWSEASTMISIRPFLRDPAIVRALQALMLLPKRQWSVERFADHSGLARSTLHERVKRAAGIAPSELLRQLKLLQAASAIRLGETTLETVAADAGYSSAASLSRAYRAAFGRSPSSDRPLSGIRRGGRWE